MGAKWPQSAARLPAEPALVDRQAPARTPTLEADVGVPLGKAVAWALMALVLLVVADWSFALDLALERLAPLVGGLGLVCGWIVESGWARRTMWAVERFAGVDLDGDGRAGTAHLVGLNPYQGQQAQERDEAAALRAQLARFVQAAAHGEASYRALEKELGRARMVEFRDRLIAQGWGRWRSQRSHTQGWDLTAPPEQVLAALVLGEPATPAPPPPLRRVR